MSDRDKILLTVPEVAHRLSMSETEVYRLIRCGVIPVVAVPDKREKYVRAADLNEWVGSLPKVIAAQAQP